jgi:hypothetical protein
MDNTTIVANNRQSSSSSSAITSIPPPKSRRGRKRVTDPILATELKYHRRSRANDRERTRMRLLNEALEHLRTLLPMDSPAYYSSADSSMSSPTMEDKLTKIETLRTASAYIRLLTDLLDDSSQSSKCNSTSIDLSHSQQHLYPTSDYLCYAPPSFSYYHSYC